MVASYFYLLIFNLIFNKIISIYIQKYQFIYLKIIKSNYQQYIFYVIIFDTQKSFCLNLVNHIQMLNCWKKLFSEIINQDIRKHKKKKKIKESIKKKKHKRFKYSQKSVSFFKKLYINRCTLKMYYKFIVITFIILIFNNY